MLVALALEMSVGNTVTRQGNVVSTTVVPLEVEVGWSSKSTQEQSSDDLFKSMKLHHKTRQQEQLPVATMIQRN